MSEDVVSEDVWVEVSSWCDEVCPGFQKLKCGLAKGHEGPHKAVIYWHTLEAFEEVVRQCEVEL